MGGEPMAAPGLTRGSRRARAAAFVCRTPWAALFAMCLCVWALTTVSTALVVAVQPLHDWLLAHSRAPHPSHPASGRRVLTIVLTNLWHAGWPLAFAIRGVHHDIGQRRYVDRLLAATLVAQTARVGAAVALYGSALAPYLVHLPLEWDALALAGAGWLLVSRGNGSPRRIAGLVAAFVLLVVVGATIETYAVPHLPR
jgi:hypothetical protein